MSENDLEGRFCCTTSGTPKLFITPHGLRCLQHALAEATDREADSQERMPPPVEQPDSTPDGTQGGTRIR